MHWLALFFRRKCLYSWSTDSGETHRWSARVELLSLCSPVLLQSLCVTPCFKQNLSQDSESWRVLSTAQGKCNTGLRVSGSPSVTHQLCAAFPSIAPCEEMQAWLGSMMHEQGCLVPCARGKPRNSKHGNLSGAGGGEGGSGRCRTADAVQHRMWAPCLLIRFFLWPLGQPPCIHLFGVWGIREPAHIHPLEGAKTHCALHRAHQRMQRFSAMYTLSEGRQGRGENALKWETFVHT